MTLTPPREHRAGPSGRWSVLVYGPALSRLGATAVITAASCQVLMGGRAARGTGVTMMFPASPAPMCAGAGAGVLALPSGGGRSPAGRARFGPFTACAGLMAALLAPAPAFPQPPGTVRHVPDLVGAVLPASAVAAGVLAGSRGGAWGRFVSHARDRLPKGPRWRRRLGAVRLRGGGRSPAAVLLAATALVRVAGATGRETESRSQRAAEEGPAMLRRLLTGPRSAHPI